jgi:hypothetical protein
MLLPQHPRGHPPPPCMPLLQLVLAEGQALAGAGWAARSRCARRPQRLPCMQRARTAAGAALAWQQRLPLLPPAAAAPAEKPLWLTVDAGRGPAPKQAWGVVQLGPSHARSRLLLLAAQTAS